MKLLISREKAIEILNARIKELHQFNFNPEAWKERTVLDLKEIFPIGSSQYIKIQFLNFHTYIESEKQKVFNETKKNAEEILKSYIDFINEYSNIAEVKTIAKEKNYEEKYFELLEERNQIVKDYNKLIGDYDKHLDEYSNLISENDKLIGQLNKLTDETIQIDNVSFLKLAKAFFNLPVWQIVSAFSVIIAIIIGLFQLGTVYEKNSNNSTIIDLKTELNETKSILKSTKEKLDKANQEVINLKETPKNNIKKT